MNTQQSKPRLTDPEEFAIIKSIYFEKDFIKEQTDPIEQLERQEARSRNLNNNSR